MCLSAGPAVPGACPPFLVCTLGLREEQDWAGLLAHGPRGRFCDLGSLDLQDGG